MITQIENIDLKPFNTFGISAQCKKWINYTEENDIPEIVALCADSKILNIGGGSNLLFTKDYTGTILHSEISNFNIAGNIVTIGAGVKFDDAIAHCCQKGLWGIENLSGIPGNAGAAAVQNIGAYGIEIKDAIKAVRCYDTYSQKFISLTINDCQYGYRSSIFKADKQRYIVASITIKLTDKPSQKLDYAGLSHLSDNKDLTPSMVRNEILHIRSSKLPDPALIGNAGSFFKNPVISIAEYQKVSSIASTMGLSAIPHYTNSDGIKIPAAWLIEQCGFKGKTLGNAGVWHKQPLVLINATGQATGNDIVALERNIINVIYDKFGILLNPEVEHI